MKDDDMSIEVFFGSIAIVGGILILMIIFRGNYNHIIKDKSQDSTHTEQKVQVTPVPSKLVL